VSHSKYPPTTEAYPIQNESFFWKAESVTRKVDLDGESETEKVINMSANIYQATGRYKCHCGLGFWLCHKVPYL